MTKVLAAALVLMLVFISTASVFAQEVSGGGGGGGGGGASKPISGTNSSGGSAPANVKITLPNLISKHMLIQQGKPIKLWGKATEGAEIAISLKSGNKIISSGTAYSADGSFSAELPAVSAGGPYTLEFTSGSVSKIVEDVLVGELWVQSGQSNMVRQTSQTGKYSNEILPDKKIDEIRIFMNSNTAPDNSPRADDLSGSWNVVSAGSVYNYSAVGYVALEKLYNELGVPVGGICNGISGSGMSPFKGPTVQNGSGGNNYNYKTAPLTQMNIRGVMWYQGEGDRGSSPDEFASAFKNLISTWRIDWNDSEMPFIYVALPPSPMKYFANWNGTYISEDFSNARLGQLKVHNEMDNVGIAVSMDCPPDPEDSEEDPLHPKNKKPIGERLGLTALGLVYGKTDKWSSPMYNKSEASGNSVTVTFSHTYGGLKTTDGNAPRCFYVAGADGKFYSAEAQITGNNTVRLISTDVSDIKTVSYAVEKYMWPYTSVDKMVEDTYADVNIVNSEGLPLCPFSYSVSEVIPEKKPLYTAESIVLSAPLNDFYKLPETVSIEKKGVKTDKNVFWSADINTKRPGDQNVYCIPDGTGLMVPAKVTVADFNEPDLTLPTAQINGGNVEVGTRISNSSTDRLILFVVGFYKDNGEFVSAKPVMKQVKAGFDGDLNLSVPMENHATKIKVLSLNGNMKPYTAVAEVSK